MGAGKHRAGQILCCLTAAALCGCAPAAGPAPGSTSGAASCVGPMLTTSPHAVRRKPPNAVTVSPGQKLRVYGYWYMTCNDTNHQPASRPYRHITIFVVQGQVRHALTVVRAGQRQGDFSATVRIPPGLQPGPATIRTSLQAELPLRLRVQDRE